MEIAIVLIWISLMSLFITSISREKYQRVFEFTQLVINRIPISKIIEALKGKKKSEE